MSDDAPPATSKDDQVRRDFAEELTGLEGADLIGRTVTINRPRAELYAYWRDLMDNVERIERLSGTRTHWVVEA